MSQAGLLVAGGCAVLRSLAEKLIWDRREHPFINLSAHPPVTRTADRSRSRHEGQHEQTRPIAHPFSILLLLRGAMPSWVGNDVARRWQAQSASERMNKTRPEEALGIAIRLGHDVLSRCISNTTGKPPKIGVAFWHSTNSWAIAWFFVRLAFLLRETE